jgi:hypothetical protein
LSLEWSTFVTQVRDELATGTRYLNFDKPSESEQELTRTIGKALRSLFLASYIPSASVHHHVVFRQGVDIEDQEAWTAAKPDKWIMLHGLRFVPDVLIRRTLLPTMDVLPVEIKLVTNLACSQAIATAIGQCFAYSIKHPHSILFVGIQRGLLRGRYGLVNVLGQAGDEAVLLRRLADNGINLVFREV